jgi:hypothetical protein
MCLPDTIEPTDETALAVGGRIGTRRSTPRTMDVVAYEGLGPSGPKPDRLEALEASSMGYAADGELRPKDSDRHLSQ